MDGEAIGKFAFYMIGLIFSFSAHELGHAWTSEKFGDDTPRAQNRITLDPRQHIDPFGSIIFPGIAFFTGAPLLGWARPVDVNPLRWRGSRHVANFWVSIAGIIVNLIIALCAGVILRVIMYADGGMLVGGAPSTNFEVLGTMTEPVVRFLEVLFQMNVGLAIFNLLPIPPLDGGRILMSFLPASYEEQFAYFAQYGFIILWILVLTKSLGVIFGNIMPLFYRLLYLGLPTG